MRKRNKGGRGESHLQVLFWNGDGSTPHVLGTGPDTAVDHAYLVTRTTACAGMKVATVITPSFMVPLLLGLAEGAAPVINMY